MIADRLLAETEAAGGEVIVILRKMLAKREAETSLVARGRALFRVGQAVGIAIGRARHAERPGLVRHHAGKTLLRTAEIFTERRRRIVGRAGDERKDRLFDGDRLSGTHPKLRWRLGGSVFRKGDGGGLRDPTGFERFEGQIERHHLGERRGIAQFVGILAVKNLAGLGIDDDARIFRIGIVRGGEGRCGKGGRCNGARKDDPSYHL
ncbi:hypothetical protein D9M70_468360 [compost metagenome]